MDDDKIALTISALVDKLSIGRSTYFKLKAQGKMPSSFRVGRRRLTAVSELNRWLQQQQLEEQNNA